MPIEEQFCWLQILKSLDKDKAARGRTHYRTGLFTNLEQCPK